MDNIEQYLKLKPYSKKKTKLKNKFLIKNNILIKKILKKFKAYLLHKCDRFENFDGRDIDAVYFKKKTKVNFFLKPNIMYSVENKKNYRVFINDNKSDYFLSIDIEEASNLTNDLKFLFKEKFKKLTRCKYTKLNHIDNVSIIYFKFIKYFYLGMLHSYNQLFEQKKKFSKLNVKYKKKILDILKKKNQYIFPFIKKLILFNFVKFENNKKIKNFFMNQRIERFKKRKVFNGQLNYRNCFKETFFLYAFIFGSKAYWPKNHLTMPAISIVGNDGSGKTTMTDYIRKNFSKMSPIIIDMKANKPLIPSINKLRNKLKNYQKNKSKKNKFSFKLSNFIIEIIDLFDKYIKYRLGMAWADAGFGICIFERYITDRLRGEFPNKNSKVFPLEQFFPFPDAFIYIDVLPIQSLKRKVADGHTIEEMKSKRLNYINLLSEFDNVRILKSNYSIIKNITEIKNYIFEINFKKNKQIQKKGYIKRTVWKKNYSRFLYGDEMERIQRPV